MDDYKEFDDKSISDFEERTSINKLTKEEAIDYIKTLIGKNELTFVEDNKLTEILRLHSTPQLYEELNSFFPHKETGVSCLLLGTQYYLQDNYKSAFRNFLKSVNKGCSTAYASIGYCYENGMGTDTDLSKAIECYKKGCAKGNNLSLNNMGYLHQEGKGVESDIGKAIDYYEKAILHGSNLAIDNLNNISPNILRKYVFTQIFVLKKKNKFQTDFIKSRLNNSTISRYVIPFM